MYGIFGEIFFSIQKTSRKYTEIFKCKRCPEYVQYQIFLKFLINFCSEVVKSGQFDPKSG